MKDARNWTFYRFIKSELGRALMVEIERHVKGKIPCETK